jgi:hypothetical protein
MNYARHWTPSARALYYLSGGAVVGACISQIAYGGVTPLPVALGIAGGAVWYRNGSNRPKGSAYSRNG